MKVSVVIGVYNERENIEELHRRLERSLGSLAGWEWEIIYVVEGDDGTREVIEGLAAAAPRVRLLYRRERSGLGAAFRRGFAARAADSVYVVTLDADLNHEPEEIPRLLAAAQEKRSDVLVGSRLVRGGCVEGMPLWKRFLSRALNLWMGGLFGMRARDKTSGFRVYRAAVLDRLAYRNEQFAFLPEMLLLAHRAGLRIDEEPIHFVYRRLGTSKMGFWSTTWSYLSLFGAPAAAPTGPSLSRRRVAVVGLGVASVVVAFLLTLEWRRPYYFLQDDNRVYHLPLWALAARSLGQGELAQFNFHQFLGVPLLAAGQPAVLSPAPYLALAASRGLYGHPFAAVDLLVAAYFLLGAVGVVVLARELGLSAPAAALAAISWPLLPLNVYLSVNWCVVAPLVGLLPWILAFAVGLARAPGPGRATGLVAAHLALFFAGYPPWTAYTVVFEALLCGALLVLGPAAAVPRRAPAVKWLVLAALTTLLLAAPLLAPLARLTQDSAERARRLPAAAATAESVRPRTWLAGMVDPLHRRVAPRRGHYFTEVGSPPSLLHLGWPALLFAVAALLALARPNWNVAGGRATAAACAALALLALIWSFGWLAPIVAHLPLLNRFRWPFRLLFFFALFALLLAGYGLDAARRRLGSRAARRVLAGLCAAQVASLWLLNLRHEYGGMLFHSDTVPLEEPWRDSLAGSRLATLGNYGSGGRTDTVRSVGFNYASLWGLFQFGGYEPLLPQANFDAMRQRFHSFFAVAPERLPIPYLRAWGVRHYVASPGAVGVYDAHLRRHGVEFVDCTPERCLYVDPAAAPLAAWAEDGSNNGLDLRVIGSTLVVGARRDRPGTVVLAFLDHPFLAVEIDGQPVAHQRLAAGQIMFDAPAGRHEIRVRYVDPFFALGVRAAAGGLALWTLVLAIERRRSPRG